jgi:A/G-specific adenine glycosylase
MDRAEKMKAFSDAIWEWFFKHKRTLPWRDLDHLSEADRAYRVWISEVMLQQTQVSRVIVIFDRFLKEFPHLRDLAQASNRDVIMAWRGMGYNSRALRLRDGAKVVMDQFGGTFPHDVEHLRSIPGIGRYTAGAIRNFAFNLPTPCIDTNIERILLRLFYPPSVASVKIDELYRLAEEILTIAIDPSELHFTKDWHAALMDFGSLVCTKTNPRYESDPLMALGLYESPYRSDIKKKAKEPLHHGEPNRIYRGRIIEALRNRPNGIPSEDLGDLIDTQWKGKKEEKVWLEKIIQRLVKDHLIEMKKDRVRLKI